MTGRKRVTTHEAILMQADPADVDRLCESLQEYNRPFTAGCSEAAIRIVARNPEGALSGGILADVALGWLEIHVLWVEPDQRATGLGAALLAECESRASALGAHSARLDTFGWQAEGFYVRQGYACFGRLGDYPAGHERIFMSKRLA